MKLITRKNFLSIVCISFTFIVCGKLIAEKLAGFTDRYYVENIFACLGFSVIITLILSLHYYLQKYPFIPVFLGQYAVTVGLVLLYVWIDGHFSEHSPNAYRDMFISVTIPFIIGAVVYYWSFFREIKKANKMIEEIGEE
jgi:predicted tellurium resistance membrane protein TerC